MDWSVDWSTTDDGAPPLHFLNPGQDEVEDERLEAELALEEEAGDGAGSLAFQSECASPGTHPAAAASNASTRRKKKRKKGGGGGGGGGAGGGADGATPGGAAKEQAEELVRTWALMSEPFRPFPPVEDESVAVRLQREKQQQAALDPANKGDAWLLETRAYFVLDCEKVRRPTDLRACLPFSLRPACVRAVF